MLDYTKSFIETQFPVSKVSKECYKERKAGAGQTLTQMGKFWGRKPTFIIRATLLGILMPISDNPVKDREIFLKILMMDSEGLWLRKTQTISAIDIYNNLNPKEKIKYFITEKDNESYKYIKDLSKENREYLQKLVFNRMSYDEKLTYCERPENICLLEKTVWNEINNHFETHASSLQELIKELGEKRFGHIPKVGDCFAGGGSIPFECARMGADVYASDLNPIATLLTWASLNIIGATDEKIKYLKAFQDGIYNEVNKKIKEWGIEKNEVGDRAEAYLYCNETICPEPDCNYKVPLAPSWIIGRKTKTVALLKDNGIDGFNIEIIHGATNEQIKESEKNITIRNGKMYCPHCGKETAIQVLRKDKKNNSGDIIHGLRKWEKNEFIPRKDDVFQERLYCIRYLKEYVDNNGKKIKVRYYTSPSKEDLDREKDVIKLLSIKFNEWQDKGVLPSSVIENGDETTRLNRERGWRYWHQLFNPRQLLYNGLISDAINNLAEDNMELVIGMLGINRTTDWNSRLSIWNSDDSHTNAETFYNQTFNTLFNFSTRAFIPVNKVWTINVKNYNLENKKKVTIKDARAVSDLCDIWITDPPYADAVNYHELSEFFLAWDKKLMGKAFPEWYTDSKRALAIKGAGLPFSKSMIEVYKNLAYHMPDNGTQVVMFTHQDVKVWSELALILWSAGLQVISAWNVATETESGGLKNGNYVKGTVLLTLRKQTSTEITFQNDLYDEIKMEVEKIIDSMKSLDNKDENDFNDADYLLASYASSLKVLTKYKEIVGIDTNYWLSHPRDSKEENPVEALINKAVKIAYDYLIPDGFNKSCWMDLTPEERFFIRGIELEINSNYKIGSYQELARGFGITNYTDMFAEFKANSTRFKTPSEFNMKFLGNGGFSSSMLRHLLVAINEVTNSGATSKGMAYLKSIYKNNEFYYKKDIMTEILNFIAKLEHIDNMEHWNKHAYSSRLLREAIKNDGI